MRFRIEPDGEQVARLKAGVDLWNEWKKENPSGQIMLFGAALSGLKLRNALLNGGNLATADLRATDLTNAKLLGANLTQAKLRGANLQGASLLQTTLIKAKLQEANLTNANCQGANFGFAFLDKAVLDNAQLYITDFGGAKLRKSRLNRVNLDRATMLLADMTMADFSHASMNEAVLNNAKLAGANLSFACLVGTQFLGADLSSANLTGACIKDWNINRETILSGVKCDYVYLDGEYRDRMPWDRDFDSGEFQRIFEKSITFIEFIFKDGVDWLALAYSLRRLRIEHNGIDASVQSIENKGDGLLVVRISLPQDADQLSIREFLSLSYEKRHFELAAEYREGIMLLHEATNTRLDVKDKQISKLLELLDTTQTELTRERNAMGNSQTRNINTGGGNYIEKNEGGYAEGSLFNGVGSIEDLSVLVNKRLSSLQGEEGSSTAVQGEVAQELTAAAKSSPGFRRKLEDWALRISEHASSDIAMALVKQAARAVGVDVP